MNKFDALMFELLETNPYRHKKIMNRVSELIGEIEMVKMNDEFSGTNLVTQEEVDQVIKNTVYGGPYQNIVERMWNEIQKLRDIVDKQIY